MNRSWLIAVGLALAWFALAPPGGAADKKTEKKAPSKKTTAVVKESADKKAGTKIQITKPIVVKMEEAPAFSTGGARASYPRGPLVRCTPEPNKEVKSYPKLTSKKPLYGSVTIDGSPFDPTAGKKFFFVLDESGETKKPADEAKKDKADDAKKDKTDEPKVKRARPADLRFDRLYFDRNGDLDLTNDGVLKLSEKTPFEGLPQASLGRVFEDLAVQLDFGAPAGKRPFVVVPRIRSYSTEMVYIDFLPKLARKGTFRLGDQEFTAWLTQSQVISGRYDRPFVQLELSSAEPSPRSPLLRPWMLGEARLIDGKYIGVSATPLGDQLTIGPYRGELGVLEVGPGGRPVTEMGVVGGLLSRKGPVSLGETFPPPETIPRRHKIPVGDYQITSIQAQCGRLRFDARMSQPTAVNQPVKPAAFPIAIRKDKPYVLEFSGKPEVVFMNPRKEATFKPGSTVAISAMLTEPWQGLQITGLYDTTQKKGTAEYRIGGEAVRVPEYTRLDPSIVIKNSLGEEVAQGKMPFG